MNKNNRKFALASAVMFLVAGVAHAEDAAPGTNATFRALDALKSQNALLTAALQNAELKAKILEAAKGKSAGKSEKESSRVNTTAADLMSAEVKMVSGAGHDLTALIALANGRQVNARVGSNIVGLGTVQSIKLNEVLVSSSKGQVNSLPFASDTPGTLPVTNLASPLMGGAPMPPFPPSMMSNGSK